MNFVENQQTNMGDPTSTRANYNTTLWNKFELEKRHLSYADLHSEVVKTLPTMLASPSKDSQKQHVGSKGMEKEEIVRHMSNLPIYLERGKHIQDRALNFGVMDWGRLEKWQYQHKQGPLRSNKCSPSSSKSSSLFSTDESSYQSSRGQSCSPSHQKPHRVTLQSHLNLSPKELFPPYVKSCSGNLDKFPDFKEALIDHFHEQGNTNQSETNARVCKMDDSYPQNFAGTRSSFVSGSCETTTSSSLSSLKGKMKIQDESVKELGNFQDPSYKTHEQDLLERHKTVVLLLPRDDPGSSQRNGKRSINANSMGFSEKIHPHLDNNIPGSSPLRREVVSSKDSQMESNYQRIPSSTSQSKTPEEKKATVSSKNSDLKMGTVAAGKQRTVSPLRRFSFSVSSKSAVPSSAKKRVQSPPVSRISTKDNSCVSNKAHSSPLRRLLDPLFPSKVTNSHSPTSHEDYKAKTKAKAKLDLGSCKEASIKNDSHRIENNESSSTKQALFQTAFKNGHPLFTFAVENSNDILAATVRSLPSSGKDDSISWIYTFFTVREVKKKSGSWLSQGSKGKGHGYVPYITAQMKVSNPPTSKCDTREFVLFAVDPGQFDYQSSDVQPQDELEAIVVKFLRKANVEENQESFSTTVILPGGNHGLPSKGELSPLIERWRSGGVCDCGGWDMGCRLRTLTNQVQLSTRSNSTDGHLKTGQFELFFPDEVPCQRPFFILSPLKEGIFSVEYNSSLSLLQAFSICISTVECRQSSQHTEFTYSAKQVQEELPIKYASFPPLSPVGRV